MRNGIAAILVLALMTTPGIAKSRDSNSSQDSGTLKFEASVKPTFAFDASSSDTRDEDRDRLQDATAESGIALTYTTQLDSEVNFEFSIGAVTDSDWEPGDDDPSTSGFKTSVKFDRALASKEDLETSAFTAIRFEHGRDNFFESPTTNNGTFEAGLQFQFEREGSPHTFSLKPSLLRVESSSSLKERWGASALLSHKYKLSEDITWATTGKYEYQTFDRVLDGSRITHFFLGKSGVSYGYDLGDDLELKLSVDLALRIKDRKDTDILRDDASIFVSPGLSLSREW